MNVISSKICRKIYQKHFKNFNYKLHRTKKSKSCVDCLTWSSGELNVIYMKFGWFCCLDCVWTKAKCFRILLREMKASHNSTVTGVYCSLFLPNFPRFVYFKLHLFHCSISVNKVFFGGRLIPQLIPPYFSENICLKWTALDLYYFYLLYEVK